MANKKMQWGTRLGVILAVAGSAVGLGNFLRFPGQAAQNGGGAFMIPYIIALVLLALPIAWAEWSMARYGGRRGLHSAPGILGVVGKGRVTRYLGVFGVLIPIVVYMYYVYIEAWCLRYAWLYLTGGMDMGTDASTFAARSGEVFANVTSIAEDGVFNQSALFWVIVVCINIFLVYRGLSGGIEKFCQFAMPAMAILAIIVLVRVLTLGTPNPDLPDQNVVSGLGFMWNPDFSKLSSFETWLAAAGQVFFSLSVGFGVILNYASYLRKKDDLVLSGLSAASTNEVFEVSFGGMITITAAFIFLGASVPTDSSFGLGFNALPVVFAHMGAVGKFIGFAWFFLLFLAAVTSSISMLQPVKTFFEEALGIGSAKAVAAVSILCGMGSLWVMWFSKDLVALDTMDFWVGTFCIFVLATVQIITFGWIWGTKAGADELNQGALLKIPRVFLFIMKWIAPPYLLVILGGFMYNNMGDRIAGLSENRTAVLTMALMGVVMIILFALVAIGERRWRAAGIDLDGKGPDPADEEYE